MRMGSAMLPLRTTWHKEQLSGEWPGMLACTEGSRITASPAHANTASSLGPGLRPRHPARPSQALADRTVHG